MDLKILICGSGGFLGMTFQRAFPQAIAGTFDIADAAQVGAARAAAGRRDQLCRQDRAAKR